eukprot:765995-Hanusia_phi.AAC.9
MLPGPGPAGRAIGSDGTQSRGAPPPSDSDAAATEVFELSRAHHGRHGVAARIAGPAPQVWAEPGSRRTFGPAAELAFRPAGRRAGRCHEPTLENSETKHPVVAAGTL